MFVWWCKIYNFEKKIELELNIEQEFVTLVLNLENGNHTFV